MENINRKKWGKDVAGTIIGCVIGILLINAIDLACDSYWNSQYKEAQAKGDTKQMAEIRKTCAKYDIRLDSAADYIPEKHVAKTRKIGFEI
jgi:hypothetical protein